MKALPLVLILVSSAVSATILVEGVNDKPGGELLINNGGAVKMIVYPDMTIDYNNPRYLNFHIRANEDLGHSEFGFIIHLPPGEWMGDPHFKLHRNNRDELIAADYIRPAPDHDNAFLLSIPAFAEGDYLNFSIGWYAAQHENYGASFYINTETLTRSLVGTWQGQQFEYVPKSP